MTPGRQLGFLWGGVALVCAASAPWASAFAKGLPPCPFHWLTGLPCATCGGTRALLALSRFELGGALLWNPLVAVSGVVFFVGGLCALGAACAGRDVSLPNPSMGFRIAFAVALASNWVFLVAAGR